MSRRKDNTGFNTPYPVNLGADVAKFRRANAGGLGSKWERHLYGEAVGAAIRKLQRAELMRALPPMPSLEKPPIKRSRSPLTVPYSRPNPFRMHGDPVERGELELYARALGIDTAAAAEKCVAQCAAMEIV